MRNMPLAATLAAGLVALLSPPAAAQGTPSFDQPAPPAPPPAVMPLPNATPGSAPQSDAARVRELQEELYAREALTLTPGGRVKHGDVSIRAGNLYVLAGRPDLVSQIRGRRVAKGLLIGGGIGMAAFGTVWALADSAATGVSNGIGQIGCALETDRDPTPASCMNEKATGVPFALAIGVGGAVAALTGAVIPSDPVDREGKRAMVDDYNQRLRTRMGLSGLLDTAKRTASVQAAVRPDGRSGMVTAGWAF